MDVARHFKFGTHVDRGEIYRSTVDKLPSKGLWSGSRDPFKF